MSQVYINLRKDRTGVKIVMNNDNLGLQNYNASESYGHPIHFIALILAGMLKYAMHGSSYPTR